MRVRRRTGARATQVRLAVAVGGFVTVVVLLGFAFAGSPHRLAEGTRIAGIDVGGLTTADAQALLERRSERLADVPVTFTVGAAHWKLRPKALGVAVDWAAAVDAAEREGGGFGFVRGYRRLELRFFSANLEPPTRVYDAALTYEVSQLAKAIDRRPRDARIVRRGLRFAAEPAQTGTALDRRAAARVIVRALASFDRAPVGLPVRSDPPRVRAADLSPALIAARTVVSAPATLTHASASITVTRWQLADMLVLPQDGRTHLRIAGPRADRFFARLTKAIDHPARDAQFAVYANGVRVVPSRPGVQVDVPRTARALLAAAERRANRTAPLVVEEAQPKRTTQEAKAMGITGPVGVYETIYGGDPNRVHNVQLVAHLVDNKLIAPGATFSFNGATGERSAAKGFREAQVIINGELQTGLGGGVCQVSTTIFNAAYEAGLPITARTNHALYISHYPLGRDATVDYPNIDLKFVNDTGHWLLLRTFVGSSSLVVGLYGTPVHRKVVTDTAPLKVVSPPPVEKTLDPGLDAGTVVVDDEGVPSQSTSVRRRVYGPNGTLLSDSTWSSYYRAEPKLVRVGTKKEEKPVPTTSTATTETTTGTTPTGTTPTGTTPTTTAPEPPH